jgi:ABC-2 type transport system permease protein
MLVSPASRSAMVLGKVLGSSFLAWLQGLVLLVFVPMTRLSVTLVGLLEVAGILFLVAFLFTALGFLLAWRMDSTQGFHAIMNLLLFPLWMVSGALFPMEKAHGWMQWVMRLNPMTYSLAALRRLLDPHVELSAPAIGVSVIVTVVCAGLLFMAATMSARQRRAA